MLTRRSLIKSTLTAAAISAFAPASLGYAAGGLIWKHFPAGQNDFFCKQIRCHRCIHLL